MLTNGSTSMATVFSDSDPAINLAQPASVCSNRDVLPDTRRLISADQQRAFDEAEADRELAYAVGGIYTVINVNIVVYASSSASSPDAAALAAQSVKVQTIQQALTQLGAIDSDAPYSSLMLTNLLAFQAWYMKLYVNPSQWYVTWLFSS